MAGVIRIYSIGQFSRRCLVSTRNLRFYDEIGLFRPAYTDKDSEYRYYTDEQLHDILYVIEMRRLGFSIAEIKSFVASDEPGRLKDALLERLTDVKEEKRRIEETLNRIELHLNNLEKGGEILDIAGHEYSFEPRIIEKGAFVLVGAEERYVNGIGEQTNESIVGVYKTLSQVCKANYQWVVGRIVSHGVTVGLNRATTNSISFSPIFNLDDGTPDEFYHMAAVEVTDIEAIPEGIAHTVIPASRYVSFSGRSLPIGGEPQWMNWDPLFAKGYYDFKRNNCLGYKEKLFSLEIAYRSNSSTIDGYELLIPIE